MEMTGEQRIEAPRERVWAALNDPDVLKACIPGCQSLEMVADDRMRAVAAVKVGPIGARFTGEVTLKDLDPPNGYRIEGEGQGGPAGFAKGGAKVRLRDDGQATILSYEVDAQVGGKLAQLGGPIIDATAKQMAAAFFRKLSDVVAPAAPAPVEASAPGSAAVGAEPAPAVSAPAPRPAPAIVGAPTAGLPVTWILAVVVALLAGVLFGRGGDSAWLGVVVLLAAVAYAGYAYGRRSAKEPRA
ncbi:MAG: carbon monoxide dehydrogenase [Phenylobacterium sp.]|nr:carbon monoxide dehydrogenase [Phenylobacterium sp.]